MLQELLTVSLLFLTSTLDGPQAFDNVGRPIPGAALTFYRAGTTVKAPIFADQELTSEFDNPIRADDKGRFPLIYLSPSSPYRVTLHDGIPPHELQPVPGKKHYRTLGGRLIWDVDPYLCDCTAPPYLFRMPRHHAIAEGRALPGAKLTFTITETETKADTFAHPLGAPHANPVRADSAGRFPPIYLNDETTYRVRLEHRGETLLDIDPYTCTCGFLLLTSRPYPIESIDGMEIAGDSRGGKYQPAFIFPPEATDIAASILGGQLRTPLVVYGIEPEPMGIDGAITGGELRMPLVMYEIEPEEIDIDGMIAGGSLETVLLRYQNYPPEETDISGAIAGGTLE